jgi:predicted enzyme related to lactoylglutathione lyase
MSLFQNVSVVSYHVKDWESAKKFYAETLEWPVIYFDNSIGWIEFGKENATHIAISRWAESDPMPPVIGGGTAVLYVEDAVKTTELLRARGVRCDDAVNIPNVVCFGTFYDPEGNRIQFASNPQ